MPTPSPSLTLRNLRAHCSTVSRSCVTTTLQRIFKRSLPVTIKLIFHKRKLKRLYCSGIQFVPHLWMWSTCELFLQASLCQTKSGISRQEFLYIPDQNVRKVSCCSKLRLKLIYHCRRTRYRSCESVDRTAVTLQNLCTYRNKPCFKNYQ